jgi:hypothetical protein
MLYVNVQSVFVSVIGDYLKQALGKLTHRWVPSK